MTKLPLLRGDDLIAKLKQHRFRVVRQKGSHIRMKHPDGRVTTVPVHAGQIIGRGLLRKILRDTELTINDIT